MYIPRFMREYASYQRKKIASSELMLEPVKKEMAKGIDMALKLYERRMITVDEAMTMITKPLKAGGTERRCYNDPERENERAAP